MDPVTVSLAAGSATLAGLAVLTALRRRRPATPVLDLSIAIAPDTVRPGDEVKVILTGRVARNAPGLERAEASLRCTHTYPVKFTAKPGEKFRSEAEVSAMTILAEDRDLEPGALEIKGSLRIPRDAEPTGDRPLKGYDDPQSYAWEVEAHLELEGGARVRPPRVPIVIKSKA